MAFFFYVSIQVEWEGEGKARPMINSRRFFEFALTVLRDFDLTRACPEHSKQRVNGPSFNKSHLIVNISSRLQ